MKWHRSEKGGFLSGCGKMSGIEGSLLKSFFCTLAPGLQHTKNTAVRGVKQHVDEESAGTNTHKVFTNN